MSELLRGPRGILIVVAVVVVIALAVVVRGFLIGDTDNDSDEGFTGNVIPAQVV
jgi:hypothetical protein